MISVIFLSENIKNLDNINNFESSSLIKLLNDKELRYQVIEDRQTILKENLNWDDILLVFYNKDCVVNLKIREVIKLYQEDNIVIPINISDNFPPPEPISGIKAFKTSDYTNFDDISKQFLIRVQALLGLKLRNPESKIFISYKSSDGKEIAKEIEVFLKVNGFDVYMDEEKDDYDSQGKLASGVDVQKELEKNLKDASMVLLLDTPDAKGSKWIRDEITWAIGNLILILPIIIDQSDGKKGSRFRPLGDLRRYVDYTKDLDDIFKEITVFLSAIYKSKHRISFNTKKVIQSEGYSWDYINAMPSMYNSEKKKKRNTDRIVSHCIYYDIENSKYLKESTNIMNKIKINFNNKLLIYDGEVLSEYEIEDIYNEGISDDFIVIHHEELKKALESNFEDW